MWRGARLGWLMPVQRHEGPGPWNGLAGILAGRCRQLARAPSVGLLIACRAAPAPGTQLPVRPIPVDAALGAQPGRRSAGAARCQVVPVRLAFRSRVAVPVAVAGVGQAPPALPAREPIRPVPAPAALDAPAGRAVALARSWRAGGEREPARVLDDAGTTCQPVHSEGVFRGARCPAIMRYAAAMFSSRQVSISRAGNTRAVL